MALFSLSPEPKSDETSENTTCWWAHRVRQTDKTDHTDRVCMQYDGTPSLDIFATVPCYYKSKTISSIPTGASNVFLLIFFLLSPSFSKAVASLHTHGLHQGTCNIKQEGGEEVRKVGRGDVS